MIEISIAQALLILIDKYSKEEKDSKVSEKPSDLSQLKRLYLCGVRDEKDVAILKEYLTDSALAEYKVSKELLEDRKLSQEEILHAYEVIDKDTSKRYFETHLAYQTMLHVTEKLNIDSLQNHFQKLYSMFQKKLTPDKFKQLKLDEALNGAYTGEDMAQIEYSEAITRIKSDKNFSAEQQQKLVLLLKISMLGVFSVNELSAPMMNIYIDEKGYFNRENRGRVEIEDPGEQSSFHLGLIRKSEPFPYYGFAASDERIEYLRPVDRSTYDPAASWVQKNFNQLVHAFVNSISGTLLAQLRIFKLFANKKILKFNDKETFSDFLACYCSVLLYTMGGHTFTELFSLLTIPEMRENFKFIDKFDTITLENIFLHENEKGLDKALKEAIAYNTLLLQRAAVRESIHKPPIKEKKHEIDFTPSPLPSDTKTELPWAQCLSDAMELYKKNKMIKNNEGYRRANLISNCIQLLNQQAKTPEEKHHANIKALLLTAALIKRGIQQYDKHSLSFNKHLSHLTQALLKTLIPQHIKVSHKESKSHSMADLALQQIERILKKQGYENLDALDDIIKNIKVIKSGKDEQIKLDFVMGRLDEIIKEQNISEKKAAPH